MPDYRVEIVETEATAGDANIGVKWDDGVAASIFPTGQADITDHANHATARNKYPENFAPDFFKLLDELFVIGDVTELALGLVIALECPVRGRCNDEVDGLVLEEGEVSSVSLDQFVS